MTPLPYWFLMTAGLATTLAAGTAQAQHTGQQNPATAPGRAVAVLVPTAGSAVHGVVTFAAVDGGGRVAAQVEGLTAGGHGFHIHEFGDCSAADGTTAGGHFNPAGAPHAGPEATARHAGDLGNLAADTQGTATYDRVDTQLTLTGPHGIIGRGVIPRPTRRPRDPAHRGGGPEARVWGDHNSESTR